MGGHEGIKIVICKVVHMGFDDRFRFGGKIVPAGCLSRSKVNKGGDSGRCRSCLRFEMHDADQVPVACLAFYNAPSAGGTFHHFAVSDINAYVRVAACSWVAIRIAQYIAGLCQ